MTEVATLSPQRALHNRLKPLMGKTNGAVGRLALASVAHMKVIAPFEACGDPMPRDERRSILVLGNDSAFEGLGPVEWIELCEVYGNGLKPQPVRSRITVVTGGSNGTTSALMTSNPWPRGLRTGSEMFDPSFPFETHANRQPEDFPDTQTLSYAMARRYTARLAAGLFVANSVEAARQLLEPGFEPTPSIVDNTTELLRAWEKIDADAVGGIMRAYYEHTAAYRPVVS